MKRIALASAALIAMTGAALADPIDSVDSVLGAAKTDVVALSDTQMSGVTGTDARNVVYVNQDAYASAYYYSTAVAVNIANVAQDHSRAYLIARVKLY